MANRPFARTLRFWGGSLIFVSTVLCSYARADVAPALVWKRTNGLCMIAAPAVGDDGTMYGNAGNTCIDNCNTNGQGLTALSSDDGSIVWGPVIPSGCLCFSTGRVGVSVGLNDVVYAVKEWNACGNGNLLAFDGEDGSLLWEHAACGPHPRNAPALNDLSNTAYFGSESLCAVDMTSGSRTWTLGGGQYIGEHGFAIDSASRIIQGSGAGFGSSTIRSASPSGSLNWSRVPRGNTNVMGLLPDDSIVYGSFFDGQPDSHQLLMYDSAGADVGLVIDDHSWMVVDADGAFYSASFDRTSVAKFDASGNQLWTVALPDVAASLLNVNVSSPNVQFLDDEGRLYVQAGSQLLALSSADGSTVWSFAADTDILWTVLAPGGQILFQDNAAALYRLDTSLNYARTVWPLATGGNRRHTQNVQDGGALSPGPCGDGVLNLDEACDDGNTNAGDCCAVDCTFESPSTTCRAASGVCDAAEHCSGTSARCPLDGKLNLICRASDGVCDAPESCNGTDDACPLDSYEQDSVICRAAAGPCDVPEHCTGLATACPGDSKSTSVCRAASDECDLDETCDGAGNDCPTDAFQALGQACGSSGTSSCDAADTCDGAGVCQSNPAVDGTSCDDALFCNGSDRCSNGLCSDHDGNPCPGADGDGNCKETCDEPADGCIADDMAGSACSTGQPCLVDETCTSGVCGGGTVDPSCCDDGDPCTQDSFDAETNECVSTFAPAANCRSGGKSGLGLSTRGDGKARWKLGRGAATACDEFGAPDADTSYDLCIYDGTGGGGYSLASHFSLPPNAAWIQGKQCRWTYSDDLGSFDGITSLRLTPGDEGLTSVQFSAVGSSPPMPAPVSSERFLSFDPDVRIQLHSSEGVCWESQFVEARKNTAEKLKTNRLILVGQ